MDEKYKQASRTKNFRYDTENGQLAIEDLWSLKLEPLDAIAKKINKELKDSAEESFIKRRSSANTLLQLKLDIIRDVIETKIAEEEAAEDRKNILKDTRQKREAAAEALRQKDMAAFNAMSAEELREFLKSTE